MRAFVALVPLSLMSAPALAQTPQPQSQAPQAQPQPRDEFALPPEFMDPRMAETLAQVLGTMTRAMMDVPVGEVQAAVEGRRPTGADRALTVRDLAGRDANFDRKIQQQLSAAMPRMQAAMAAMSRSLPAMARAMEKVADEMGGKLGEATANLPQPGYPKQ